MVGANSGTHNITHPTEVDYVVNNIIPYQTDIAHWAGFAVFALETPGAASSSAFGQSTVPNVGVAEPWYSGFQPQPSDGPYDPFYSAANNTAMWESFSTVINNLPWTN